MEVPFKFAAVICTALLAGWLYPKAIAAITRRCGLKPVEWTEDTAQFLRILFIAFFVLLCLLASGLWRTVYLAVVYILGWIASTLDVKYHQVPKCAAFALCLAGVAFALSLLHLNIFSMASGCIVAGAILLLPFPWNGAINPGSSRLSAAMGLCTGLRGIACIAATTLLLLACYFLIQRFCYGVSLSRIITCYLPVVPFAFVGFLFFLLFF